MHVSQTCILLSVTAAYLLEQGLPSSARKDDSTSSAFSQDSELGILALALLLPNPAAVVFFLGTKQSILLDDF